jgi:SAM-dependent methyltransferase/predicted O-methyltransferase YrrM
MLNERETEKVKELWGSSDAAGWKGSKRIHWLQHPKVHERINSLVSGDPLRDPYQYFIEKFYGVGLPRKHRVQRGLTLGCGTGEFERGLSQYRFVKTHDGIDIADGAIETAQKAAAAEGFRHLHYRVEDLNTLRLPECTYDVVFGIESIHHISNLEQLFESISMSVKPGGYFVLDEYIGPNKFQWTPSQLEAINDEILKLPPDLKRSVIDGSLKGPGARLTIEQIDAVDPSEAVRSADILKVLETYFDVLEIKGYGGSLLHWLLEGITGNFDEDDPRAMSCLKSLFDREDDLIAGGVLRHDFALIIAKRRPTRIQRVFGRRIAYAFSKTRSICLPRQSGIESPEVGLTGAQTQGAKKSKQVESLWVPPGHYYSPIPAAIDVKMNEAEIFTEPPAIRGVDLNETGQLRLLKEFAALYPEQPFSAGPVSDRRYFFENPNYSYSDAIFLYCMIRHLRPRQMVEIGSGYSSCAILDINELFFGNSMQCTFIDPYPQLLRDLIRETDQLRVRVIGQKIQDVSLDVFTELGPNDILFIDSSHVAKTGSDVNYILFKILPLLKAGVYIHFHDIFYPFEYPQEIVYEGRAWNEAYVLRAFLQYNRSFQIQFFSTFLIWKYKELFESQFPLCLKRPGGQIWMKKVIFDPELDRVFDVRARTLKLPTQILDLSRPEHLYFLNDGWYLPEPGHCWMSQTGVLQIAAPAAPGQHLTIHAWSPHLKGATLSATANDILLGAYAIGETCTFTARFSLPPELVGLPFIQVRLALDRVHTKPDDPRKLGLSVRRIEVQ